MYQIKQNKKLFHSICEPLVGSKSGILEDRLNYLRSGDLEKSGPGPREKTDAENEKLRQSIIAKTSQSKSSQKSINKLVQKVGKVIDPVISNQKFWRILNAKPVESKLTPV